MARTGLVPGVFSFGFPGRQSDVNKQAISVQWEFQVQGLSTACPDPITHWQGSAPAHCYSYPDSCGLRLSSDHQLGLEALADHHTLRVVALLQPPLADQPRGTLGAAAGQQTPTNAGLEPAAAGYPASPFPFSLRNHTAMGSPYAAPAAAPEEPQVEHVEERIDWLVNHPALVKGKLKLERTEALQVIAYDAGEFYTEHYDNKAGGVVTRAATIVCYLSDCPAGGATYFPKSTGQ
ncbi:hypothetical protein DUNSADRAFT_18409 [Dunaliella salina]|uniref:Prolyl 4-hydroxylase alpha subunit domain-containing protein n=1 Tax=Dunaliella salina TaxID=3046 RepID=A0ABQ7GZ29_DUNSA|nr:hypothetical protein DUNSADRAFT_18409 [Dunaliella salina]|eukprot:KAF5839866.1 hypothetical protein DUNSADRAFT_18409 [Dunaliella salina]